MERGHSRGFLAGEGGKGYGKEGAPAWLASYGNPTPGPSDNLVAYRQAEAVPRIIRSRRVAALEHLIQILLGNGASKSRPIYV